MDADVSVGLRQFPRRAASSFARERTRRKVLGTFRLLLFSVWIDSEAGAVVNSVINNLGLLLGDANPRFIFATQPVAFAKSCCSIYELQVVNRRRWPGARHPLPHRRRA